MAGQPYPLQQDLAPPSREGPPVDHTPPARAYQALI